MMLTIEVVFSPTSDTRMETKGFAGAACQQASRFLEVVAKTGERLAADYYR